jgi:hypothetical protein
LLIALAKLLRNASAVKVKVVLAAEAHLLQRTPALRDANAKVGAEF